MRTVHVLLLDTKESVKHILEHRLLNVHSMKFIVTLVGMREAKQTLRCFKENFDVVLFGEKTSPTTVIDLSNIIRARDVNIPIFKLTMESEAKLPHKFEQAGVDDMLNIAEMTTPLFGWTFRSMLEHEIGRAHV